MSLIGKPTILITSLGRTGTEFFSKFFADVLPNSTSLHEPDIVQNVGVDSKLTHFFQQVERAGVWKMIFLKPFGRWTLVRLSDSRFRGNLDYRQAVQNLYDQRKNFILKMPGAIYVESNIGFYGLLDITPKVFKNHKAIFIVRDGREWIRSHLNWGEFYGKKGIRKLVSHKWPTARDIHQDPYNEKWDTLSRFEQLCWAWARLNGYALETLSRNSDARMFSFEKIFSGKQRYQALEELVAFSTALPEIEPVKMDKITGWLERRIHQSLDKFPNWDNWTREQKGQFELICGPMMEKLDYKIE